MPDLWAFDLFTMIISSSDWPFTLAFPSTIGVSILALSVLTGVVAGGAVAIVLTGVV